MYALLSFGRWHSQKKFHGFGISGGIHLSWAHFYEFLGFFHRNRFISVGGGLNPESQKYAHCYIVLYQWPFYSLYIWSDSNWQSIYFFYKYRKLWDRSVLTVRLELWPLARNLAHLPVDLSATRSIQIRWSRCKLIRTSRGHLKGAK